MDPNRLIASMHRPPLVESLPSVRCGQLPFSTLVSPLASERIQRQIDRLLDEAEEAVESGQWNVVRARAQTVLALDPDNADALTFSAAAERSLGGSSAELVSARPIATVSVPNSFANGRCQVKEFLGEGGRKRVYQAHDNVLDRDVALAVIKTEGLDATSRVRITREAQALGRLGDHPHVLSIHDLGDEGGGQPYMVLPLMPGGDVGSLISAAEDHRLPLEQAIDLATQVCLGLEFAHSKDIVHRDLKPGNVWLTADGTARIGDFGLAVAIDRSRLTQEGMMVVTVSYMPPEQAMGGDVTPQSDLYSLGAMLYEMVTGRPPFLGDDSVAIIGQHINTPPVAPTWHNQQCPRALEALIMRLLAKDPAERPESATDAITALEGVDLTVSADELAPERDEAHALDSLAGGVFVGRQREMGELKALLEDALSGRGRMTTLVGEPGIGKTRTAEEIATYARMRGAQVLWGRCYEEQGVPPYWPWVQAIRSYVREREPEKLRSEMGTGAVDIAEIVSDVRERLPDLQAAPQLEPEQARFRLFDSIAAFLKTASQRQPLVLVLDDLHWADQPSLLLLQFVARELGGARLLIIGTYRDMELPRHHPLAEALGELTRERLFQRVVLRGLAQEDVARFIEIASGNNAPRGLVEAVHSQTEGNPLFVTEVVRLLVQEGELAAKREDRNDSWTLRIPEGVREVIGRRLNRLSQHCNETLTVASIVGREFTLAQLRPLVEEVSDDGLLEILEEALASRVIEELPQSVGRYQFTHALIQETLVGTLSINRRVRMHAQIAMALEAIYGDDADARAAELAHHMAEAQTLLGTDKLVHYSLLAGQRALSARAYEEAEAHLQRGLAGKGVALTSTEPAKDGEAAALLSCLGQAQMGTRSGFGGSQVLATLTRAFGYYVSVGDVVQAVGIAAHHLPVNFGRELIEKALELVPPHSHDAGRLLSRSITPLRSEYDKAQEAVHGALAIARQQHDLELEMRTLVSAACVDISHCHYGQCLDHNLRAIQLAQQLEQPFDESHARFDVSRALSALGDLEEAARHAGAMLEVADRSGNRHWRTFAMETNQSLIPS